MKAKVCAWPVVAGRRAPARSRVSIARFGLSLPSRRCYAVEVQALQPIPAPLRLTEHGVLQISGTRVTLDSLVSRFDAGATPEEIVQQFPSLGLAEVYAVVAYVLSNRAEVDAYLEKRARIAESVRTEVERRWPAAGLRERLLARRR